MGGGALFHGINLEVNRADGICKENPPLVLPGILITQLCGEVQAKCIETGETVAIKKVLQDKRYKNRELQIMRMLDHSNIVALKHCFFSTTDKDELYLNLVLEYIPETVYRIAKHYSRMNQRMPLVYVKLYTYQVFTVAHSWG